MDFTTKILLNMARLNVLRDLAMLEAEKENIYDRITQLASKAIGAPVSLVSMVAADYQFFKSHVGLPEPWKSRRRTPLSHSFCQHVVATNEPLIVTDARQEPLVKDNRAIPDLNVIGYLGMPLTLHDGKPLGSFCVIDSKPREWTETEIAIVRELSEVITHEIDTRAMVHLDRAYKPQLDELRTRMHELVDRLNPDQSEADFLAQLRDLRRELELDRL